VCAFPGRTYDTRSKGCNRLIRQQAAALITNADDFLELMNWKAPQKKIHAQQLPIDFGLDEQEKTVYQIIAKQGDMQLNELVEKSGMPIQELTGILMELELRNKVRCLPGSMYHCI
jgi:Predicted Rossmann fold nucleotide-binding protein involved in DNA uptake